MKIIIGDNGYAVPAIQVLRFFPERNCISYEPITGVRSGGYSATFARLTEVEVDACFADLMAFLSTQEDAGIFDFREWKKNHKN